MLGCPLTLGIAAQIKFIKSPVFRNFRCVHVQCVVFELPCRQQWWRSCRSGSMLHMQPSMSGELLTRSRDATCVSGSAFLTVRRFVGTGRIVTGKIAWAWCVHRMCASCVSGVVFQTTLTSVQSAEKILWGSCKLGASNESFRDLQRFQTQTPRRLIAFRDLQRFQTPRRLIDTCTAVKKVWPKCSRHHSIHTSRDHNFAWLRADCDMPISSRQKPGGDQAMMQLPFKLFMKQWWTQYSGKVLNPVVTHFDTVRIEDWLCSHYVKKHKTRAHLNWSNEISPLISWYLTHSNLSRVSI